MLYSPDRQKESSVFRITEKLAGLARAKAVELVESGGQQAFVQESPGSPTFLLSRDEGDVTVFQRIDVGGVVFYLGLSKMST
jgi:hypothetical protein